MKFIMRPCPVIYLRKNELLAESLDIHLIVRGIE